MKLTQEIYDRMSTTSQRILKRYVNGGGISMMDCIMLLADPEVKRHPEFVAALKEMNQKIGRMNIEHLSSAKRGSTRARKNSGNKDTSKRQP